MVLIYKQLELPLESAYEYASGVKAGNMMADDVKKIIYMTSLQLLIKIGKALCPLKAIEPLALFYRYNFRTRFSGHGIGSIASLLLFLSPIF